MNSSPFLDDKNDLKDKMQSNANRVPNYAKNQNSTGEEDNTISEGACDSSHKTSKKKVLC